MIEPFWFGTRIGVDEMAAHAGALVLLRHGQSTTNAAGVFTGWLDVGISTIGRREAKEAGRRLRCGDYRPGCVHTSTLRRAIETTDIVLSVLGNPAPSAQRSWRLNERHYGALTGRIKTEVLAEVGPGTFLKWRNSLTVAPPPLTKGRVGELRAARWPVEQLATAPCTTESLGDVVARVVPYWTSVLAPLVASGVNVLVVAHGNSLRALSTVLDGLSQDELTSLRLPTGHPVAYSFDPAVGGALVPRRRGGSDIFGAAHTEQPFGLQ